MKSWSPAYTARARLLIWMLRLWGVVKKAAFLVTLYVVIPFVLLLVPLIKGEKQIDDSKLYERMRNGLRRKDRKDNGKR
jgi:hypothetical protein